MNITERILVIEDDEGFRKTLVDTLKKEGYVVEGVANAGKALSLAKKEPFDLIVADVRLPGRIDGIEIVNRIKKICPKIKTMVIVITGYADEEAPVRAIQARVDDYIYKPFKLDFFLNSVKKNLELLKYEREEKDYVPLLNRRRDQYDHFDYEVTVYPKDTSLFGTIYFPHYFEWTEMCREEYYSLAMDYEELLESGITPVTKKTWMDFGFDSRAFDKIIVRVQTQDIKNFSFEMIFTFIDKRTGKTIAHGGQLLAFLDKDSNFIQIPDVLSAVIRKHKIK